MSGSLMSESMWSNKSCNGIVQMVDGWLKRSIREVSVKLGDGQEWRDIFLM